MSTTSREELTTRDVIECARELEKMAVSTFLHRPRVTEGMIRAFLTEHHAGTTTERADFDEATRRYLMTKWNIQ